MFAIVWPPTSVEFSDKFWLLAGSALCHDPCLNVLLSRSLETIRLNTMCFILATANIADRHQFGMTISVATLGNIDHH